MADTLGSFLAELAAVDEEIERGLAAAQSEVALAAYEALIARSPVRTGAYRANHAISRGDANGPLVYEGPARPGETPVPYRPGAAKLAPPSVSDARAALAGIPLGRVTIWNDRPYAEFLEYGTSRMAPRLIYQLSADGVEAAADSLDFELPASVR